MIRSFLGRLMSSFTPLIEAHRFKALDRQTLTTEGIDDRQQPKPASGCCVDPPQSQSPNSRAAS